MNSLKKRGLSLFYQILKLHQGKLPADMKNLGNAYLKGEFKLHQNASQIQYKEFLDQWELYYLDLKKSDSIKKIGRNLTKEEITLLNDDQKKTLANLQSSVKKIK